ncbi:hypothetical protein HUK65_17685 [Rhodobacteraceae bacterium 2376]|uniref:Uncharacterized protein n=1 Tax=Rhabdonatronobacter sediminivivens TaxID=2743469 RepID=A0A7Z0I2L1_9RHOB|nr:hypothetical protein [Rhabdonatronobacter sediminivivens]NYS26801.1 hypothetical protein [Rhabdonatronobacter sediminivivens]
MDRRSLFLMIGASALVACAPQPYSNPLSREARAGLAFSRFDVVTTGASFDSSMAANYASRLGADLAAALRSEFSDRVGADGVVMNVEIARFNLAGSTRTAMGRDQSQLQGSVRIIDRAGRLLATYPIQVVAGAAAETRTGALARAAVTTTDGFYRGLLSGFARTSREQILGSDLPGQRLLRRVTAE